MSDNEFEDDIVFAKYIRYMELALIHEKMNYENRKSFINKRERKLDDKEWSKIPDETDTNNPFEALKRDYDDLNYAISKLTQKQRYVIINYYFKGRTLSFIAKKLNSNISAVEQLKIRALLSLRRYMEGLYGKNKIL